MGQKPKNPFSPGDRVVKRADGDVLVASLDTGPDDWRVIHPALLTSYCAIDRVDMLIEEDQNLGV
jgi:hypothetical protein